MKLDSLITNVSNSCDFLTNECIQLLSTMSKCLGISYGELNVYIFIIWMPLLIIYFTTTTLICVNTSNKNIIKRVKYLTYCFISINVLLIICIVFTFLTYIFLVVKSENMLLG